MKPLLVRFSLLLSLAFLPAAGCSKKGRDYGALQCLDDWPAQPAAGTSPSLAVTPALIWQADLGLAAAPHSQPGVALSNDRVVFSAGASWAAHDRRTGARLFVRSTSPGNYFLSAPVVDSQGQIYVQSSVTLNAFAPDGTARWTYALDTPRSAEPDS